MRLKAVLVGAAGYVLVCAGLTTASALFAPDCDSFRRAQAQDIGVVLGGSLHGSRNWSDAQVGRPRTAIAMYQRSLVRQLHMTGKPAQTLQFDDADIALKAGVPADKVTFETKSRSTLQNALFSLPYLPKDRSIVLITDDYHVLRAQAAFAWAGRPATGCAATMPPRPTRRKLQHLSRETAAWAVNIPRAGIWFLGRMLGLEQHMPEVLLS